VNRVINEENNTKCNQFVIAALISHAKEIQSQNFGAVNKDYVIYAAERQNDKRLCMFGQDKRQTEQ